MLTISGRALRGQSFAIKPIKRGQPYITLGDPIGLASRNVKTGEPIDSTNLHSRLPRLTPQLSATIPSGAAWIPNFPR